MYCKSNNVLLTCLQSKEIHPVHGCENAKGRVMVVYVFRIAREFDVVKIKVTKEGQERVERLIAADFCLGCEQPLKRDEGGKLIHVCGQCKTCYCATRRAIRAGRQRFEDLVRDGFAIPRATPGRKPVNKFTRMVAASAKR